MGDGNPRRVVFQPDVHHALGVGISKIVDAVRPTYGPLHGTVMLSRVGGVRLPEVLDDGGLIARRIYALPDRDEDVGAMMVRHLMWRMHERFGDASVTAALVYKSVFNQGCKHIASGGNAMLLRRHLEAGAKLVAETFSQNAIPVADQGQLVRLADTLCHDAEIAQSLGEIYTRVGRYGQVDVRADRGRISRLEYINGMIWKGEFFSRNMVMDMFKYRSELQNPAILVSNLHLTDPYQLANWLESVFTTGVDKLVILAKVISQECLAVLDAVNRSSPEIRLLAVNLWETTERWELQDLTILTGGTIFAREAGYSLANVKPEHLGHADQLWVERDKFGVIGGRGDSQAIQGHFQRLILVMQQERDEKLARKIKEHIARLAGISAIYWIGGNTQTEIEEKVKLAKRTADTMREALIGGVLPGGAVALLDCLPALVDMQKSLDFDERAAGRIIGRALQVPIHALLANCGESTSNVLAEIKLRGKGYGFDVRNRKVVDMVEVGVLDVANAIKAAVYGGIIGAALGLTVDVIVHPKKRKESFTTG